MKVYFHIICKQLDLSILDFFKSINITNLNKFTLILEIEYTVLKSYDDLHKIKNFMRMQIHEEYTFHLISMFLVQSQQYCHLAKTGDQIIGVVMARTLGECGYIALLGTDSSYRRQGIAEKLLRRCISSFTRNGFREVIIETEVNNAPSMSLYKKLGFIKTNFRENYYTNKTDAYELRLYLEADKYFK